MRKSLISLLLLSAVAPATAYVQDGSYEREADSKADPSERAIQRNDGARPQRVERARSGERPARPELVERAVFTSRSSESAPRIKQPSDLERTIHPDRIQRAERPARTDRAIRDPRPDGDLRPALQDQTPAAAQPVGQTDGRSSSLVDGFRRVGRDIATGRNGDHHSHDRGDDDRDWSRDWRKDRRYDWWNYRNRYRSLFRLGHYYDPYGWGYRRWSVGYGLWPSYYGSSFWLNDPWMYRLPQAYGPYRWVRYYDDALLVDIYSGHVVDVIYNFFW